MKTLPATMLNTPMVVRICIAGTLIFMQGKYLATADRPIDSNVPAPNVNNVNVGFKDATQRHITSKFVGGFHTPAPPSKRLHRSQIISRMTKPPKNIINKHVSKSNYYGYRYKGSSEKSNGNPVLKEHVGASDSYSTSKRIHYNSPHTHILPSVSSFSKRDQRARPKLSSSIATTFPRTQSPLITVLNQKLSSIRNKIGSAVPTIDKQDFAIVIIYICTMLAISIPIILLPMIAADPFLPNSISHLSPKMEGPAFVGAMVSLSTLGASVGKFANGFVCKSVGGRTAGSLYLLGLAAFSLLLSTTASLHGVAIAGMEFCASIMWTACSVIFANRYERDPQKFSAAIMMLSLGSTFGVLMAKVFGTVLLSKLHWRQVARISSIMAATGSAIMYYVVKETPRENRFKSILWANGGSQEDNGFTLNMISESASRVLSNRAFWMIGFAHATSFIARSSDKLLGSFVRDTTGLPAHFCGGLTSSVTMGFVIGLISGRKIHSLESLAEKRMFTLRRYQRATFSAIGLALCANRALGAFVGSTFLAVAITLISGVMAYSVAFQFYQFPTAFGSGFGNDKAVCISFLDGIACLIVSPIWSMVGKLVVSTWVGSHGWSIAWLAIAGFFGIGGNVMMKNLSSVMP